MACLRLDQPSLALTFSEQISDWQKGSCQAELALYCAQHGNVKAARHFIALAETAANAAEDWRRDVINVKLAQVHLVLGDAAKAQHLESGVIEAEQGKVDQIRAAQSLDKDFGATVEKLNANIATGTFDLLKNSLDAYARLYGAHYADAERRALIEEKMISSWETMPILHRIELLNQLATAALDHDDKPKALALVNDAQALFESHEWPAEHRVSVASPIITLRHKSGDTEKAKADAQVALASFDQNRQLIFDIWRAGALRPLAETFLAIGDVDSARATWSKAIEEGAINPNSRPKAEDLSATCTSMAVSGFEPSEELWKRIQEIKGSLSDPW